MTHLAHSSYSQQPQTDRLLTSTPDLMSITSILGIDVPALEGGLAAVADVLAEG